MKNLPALSLTWFTKMLNQKNKTSIQYRSLCQSSNSSFSLTLECPTSGENLPRALRRTELTSKVPGMGVDDLRSSQGFCRFPPGVCFVPTGLLGAERGSDPLLLKSMEQSSDSSVIFWNEALFLIEVSTATSVLLLLTAFSSICRSLCSICTVIAWSSVLPSFPRSESFPSRQDLEDFTGESLFSIFKFTNKLVKSDVDSAGEG